MFVKCDNGDYVNLNRVDRVCVRELSPSLFGIRLHSNDDAYSWKTDFKTKDEAQQSLDWYMQNNGRSGCI